MTEQVPQGLVAAEVVLSEVREQPLSVDEVLDAVRHPQAGGIALFVGVVRDHDHGTAVASLDYSAHPSVVEALSQVCLAVAARHPVARVGAIHRVGHLEIGDLAVVAAVSSAHRGEAFDACRDLVDTLKTTVPIWKHQQFADGTDEWVGLP
ncbi:molybdenum cofactor biosynthesis protein MoaE [Pedococcus sp. 5OH_020]|jgi:molybdopterin synthase catalytic subunit|uniref:molybdenum cofactor biosynthesis protein MoaE n=1 Tax=Pedococcus sp. 5OH_020 TaxID=2989814 RepID=UPI0022E9EC87|nr:molybdenum cofactor biosynthesis protein MoaE [Pedococcus sp. 5OH_020]